MHNIHTTAWIMAAKNVGHAYQLIGDSGVFLNIKIGDTSNYFIANKTPFNSANTSEIGLDKGHTHSLLSPHIQMPPTTIYIDPHPHQDYLRPYRSHQTLGSLSKHITSTHPRPLIIKPNRKSEGLNTFYIAKSSQVQPALSQIFAKTPDYDYSCLVQPYIDTVHEYRVITFQKKIMCIYLKNNHQATYTNNISPLHWHGATADIVTDQRLQSQINSFLMPFFDHSPFVYTGLDLLYDQLGNWWLLEVNTRPAYHHFIRSNGHSALVDLYSQILSLYTNSITNPQ